MCLFAESGYAAQIMRVTDLNVTSEYKVPSPKWVQGSRAE